MVTNYRNCTPATIICICCFFKTDLCDKFDGIIIVKTMFHVEKIFPKIFVFMAVVIKMFDFSF